MLISYKMLKVEQQSVFDVNLTFSVFQTFFLSVFIFNPLNRKKYEKTCGRCPEVFGYISVFIVTVLMPLAIFIYNGVVWSSAGIHNSFIKVWLLTFILINAAVWVGGVVQGVIEFCRR